MKRIVCLVAGVAVAFQVVAFRPPAVPLVSCDPFFSVWSAADRLTDAETTHWAGAKQPISVTLAADGRTWRLCGLEPKSVPALPQTGVEVRPLQTVCTFAKDALKVRLVFSTAKLTDDLDVFSRPVTYVTAYVEGVKEWRLDASISPALATNDDKASMATNRCMVAGMPAMSIGRKEQRPLSRGGDRVRCDWGWAWLVGPSAAKGGEAHFMLAYDDVKALKFFGDDLPAWWRREGMSFAAMLEKAEAERVSILKRLDAFDAELYADLMKAGGEKYAKLASLAYRQTFAACKLAADRNKQPVYISKENDSGGLAGTVDVLYPQAPQMLLVSPTLMRAMLAPVLLYANHSRWPWPFAPHDLGLYPLAEGQVYGGGEKSKDESRLMPVEECGNMIISLAALAQAEGTAEFASYWWPTVTKWAEYLAKFGFDPGNQLCTDDFAGHLAHNANLAAKSIVALACYARLAGALGHADAAAKYSAMAKDMVTKWMDAAKGGAEGGYRLAYDRPGTWSMKYNLVWDRVLGLGLFQQSVFDAEMAAYRRLAKSYGIPLDNRKTWTKTDWELWCAVFTGRRADFDAIVDRVYRFADETPSRVAFSDWYMADSGKYVHFIGRSVIGGVLMPMLCDKAVWKKYASRDKAKTGIYAPLREGAGRDDDAFNLASFNVRCPSSVDKGSRYWTNRFPYVAKVIKDRAIDIVGVQELASKQRKVLDVALGKEWGRVGVGRLPDDNGESMTIYYRKARFECLATDTFWLSEEPRTPGSKSWGTSCTRNCTWGLFRDKKTGRRFRYYNTHLDHVSAEARIKGMALILDVMRRLSQGETVFLTGDMNSHYVHVPAEDRVRLENGGGPSIYAEGKTAHPIATALRTLYDTRLRSETPHEGPLNTYSGYKPYNSCLIDFIFTTGNVRVLRHATCHDRPDGVHPSDHDAVAARLVIE